MTTRWRAVVQVAGVPAVYPLELEGVAALTSGSVRHEKGRLGGRLWLDWSFTTPGPEVEGAVRTATRTYRAAVGLCADARKPVCVDFRVMRTTGP